MKRQTLAFRTLAIVLLAVALEGCAAGRSVVTLDDLNATETPHAGIEVALNTPVDNRRFELKPKKPRTPSFDPSDIEAEKNKIQLVGRKRNAYGMALGSVALPEGETVSTLFTKIVKEGFSLAGYRVLDPSDTGYDQAKKVEVNISKFWTWFTPGAWTVKASNEAEVWLKGDIADLKDAKAIYNLSDTPPSMAITDEEWSLAVNMSAKAVSKKIAEHLKSVK